MLSAGSLAGLTPRTLRYYDAVGLLSARRIADARYSIGAVCTQYEAIYGELAAGR